MEILIFILIGYLGLGILACLGRLIQILLVASKSLASILYFMIKEIYTIPLVIVWLFTILILKVVKTKESEKSVKQTFRETIRIMNNLCQKFSFGMIDKTPAKDCGIFKMIEVFLKLNIRIGYALWNLIISLAVIVMYIVLAPLMLVDELKQKPKTKKGGDKK